MHTTENIRHGDKNKDGSLSDAGREQAREKAQELFGQIREADPGTVVYVTSSSVGRAAETGQEIETELRNLCHGISKIEFIDVHDEEEIKRAKNEPSKKFVITGIQPSSLIGFTKEQKGILKPTPYLEAWGNYGKKFGGDDYATMLVWVAQPQEMGDLRNILGKKFPGLEASNLNPADFVQTPEEEAIKYLRLMKRTKEITSTHFPGRPVMEFQVGHNVAETATLALMGKEINLQNLKELLDGQGRGFLESAVFEERDGTIFVSYRGTHTRIKKSFEDVIQELERQSELRKSAWQK